MPRSIDDFQGLAVVIGCTHFHSFCATPHLHKNEKVFYSIDLNDGQNPDFAFDITHELPLAFKNKFKLTLLENLDYTAYNKSRRYDNQGVEGFNNIWEMTAEDGFIVIVGCPRQQEFRERVTQHKLNYIELDTDHECILIPKNQILSFEEVQEQIKKLESVLRSTIDGATTHKKVIPNPEKVIPNPEKVIPNPELNFCKVAYEDMDTIAMRINFRSQVKEQRKQTKEPQPQQAEVNINSSPITNISLMVLSGFIAAVGITAVAIAFTVLNAATFGIAGIVVATIGVTLALSGMGLFAASAYKNRQKKDEASVPVSTCE